MTKYSTVKVVTQQFHCVLSISSCKLKNMTAYHFSNVYIGNTKLQLLAVVRPTKADNRIYM